MAYSKRLFTKVTNAFQDIRNAHKRLVQQREIEIYEKIPQIEKIDSDLRKLGFKLTKSVMGGADVEASLEKIREESRNLEDVKQKLLIENGYPEDYLLIKYNCDVCKDEGFVDGVMCKCFERTLKEEAYKYSNLPILMDSRTFDDFNLELYPDDESDLAPRKVMQFLNIAKTTQIIIMKKAKICFCMAEQVLAKLLFQVVLQNQCLIKAIAFFISLLIKFSRFSRNFASATEIKIF